jgi:hypothetical protein
MAMAGAAAAAGGGASSVHAARAGTLAEREARGEVTRGGPPQGPPPLAVDEGLRRRRLAGASSSESQLGDGGCVAASDERSGEGGSRASPCGERRLKCAGAAAAQRADVGEVEGGGVMARGRRRVGDTMGIGEGAAALDWQAGEAIWEMR